MNADKRPAVAGPVEPTVSLHECDNAIEELAALVRGWDANPFSAIAYDAGFENRDLVRDCLKLARSIRNHVTANTRLTAPDTAHRSNDER
jgi:hypothetical protein